ncbi:hypothetical protein PIB30_044292 [Stylosanthes scabra]|uniref:Uncharacterized protein n=1 Tax=Stylosanthes scabra TaxID=79078 RepID=A0ABU6UJ29_9FABA|nr:hypothetical protein [Stylosanthes scabra]
MKRYPVKWVRLITYVVDDPPKEMDRKTVVVVRVTVGFNNSDFFFIAADSEAPERWASSTWRHKSRKRFQCWRHQRIKQKREKNQFAKCASYMDALSAKAPQSEVIASLGTS